MRRKLPGAMLAGVLALAGAQIPVALAQGMNGKYVKPSSLAPRERAYKNAYGAPVSKPIVTRRVDHKAKSQPQLRSSPLPAS